MKKRVILILLLAGLTACEPFSSSGPDARLQGLDIEFLTGRQNLKHPLPNQAFAFPEVEGDIGPGIRGLLHLAPGPEQAGVEIIYDEFAVAANDALQLRQFSSVSIQLVSDGPAVIPVVQTPRRGEHPYWEFMVLPGRQWTDPDQSSWTRVSLPFALKERNQNCIHNGLLGFAISDRGDISRAAWQISSETCRYLKANLWGMLSTRFEAGGLETSEAVINRHRINAITRLPVKPLESLIEDYPTLPLNGLVPADTENTSVHGFVMGGVHYRGACSTRTGPYPFCDELVVPSYSLAKSIFAGAAYLRMIQQWPEFGETKVGELVNECRLPDQRWSDVQMSDLVNMTTGNYDELTHGRDEGSAKMGAFFVAEGHQGKIRFACEAWPRQAAPGTHAVYHTTDTYILGSAMNQWIRQQIGPGADIYGDFLHPQFIEPLNLSGLTAWTQRTYDDVAQPFTSHGLVMLPDDIASISVFLYALLDEYQLLDSVEPVPPIFQAADGKVRRTRGNDLAYGNGFWGIELSALLGCENETWVPFMSGYGGISVALFPNATIYYHFSDGSDFRFKDAAVASHSLIKMCD